MADDKNTSKATPPAPGRGQQTNAGAPSVERKTARNDATDPLQAPAMDASPERFLSEVPAHIAAQGDDAPPVPGALSEIQRKAGEKEGKKAHRLNGRQGWFDGHTHHAAGAEVMLSDEQAERLRSLKMLDEPEVPMGRQAGQPLGADEDEAMRLTGEARGQLKR